MKVTQSVDHCDRCQLSCTNPVPQVISGKIYELCPKCNTELHQFLRLEMQNATPLVKSEGKAVAKIQPKKPRQRVNNSRIIEVIKADPNSTVASIAEKCKLASMTARSAVKKLLKSGTIKEGAKLTSGGKPAITFQYAGATDGTDSDHGGNGRSADAAGSATVNTGSGTDSTVQ